VKSEPYVQFVLDAVASLGWRMRGKQMIAFSLDHGLSESTLRNWQTGKCSPRLDRWLTVLDGLGYEVTITAKEPAE